MYIRALVLCCWIPPRRLEIVFHMLCVFKLVWCINTCSVFAVEHHVLQVSVFAHWQPRWLEIVFHIVCVCLNLCDVLAHVLCLLLNTMWDGRQYSHLGRHVSVRILIWMVFLSDYHALRKPVVAHWFAHWRPRRWEICLFALHCMFELVMYWCCWIYHVLRTSVFALARDLYLHYVFEFVWCIRTIVVFFTFRSWFAFLFLPVKGIHCVFVILILCVLGLLIHERCAFVFSLLNIVLHSHLGHDRGAWETWGTSSEPMW